MDGISLLNFLDAPFVVGDPDGRIVYVNPAFARCFANGSADVVGTEMAAVFSGGGREAMLSAVALVCGKGRTVRFRIREEGRGFLGVASPIEATASVRADSPEGRLGVVILLLDEPGMDARLASVQREIQEPLEEAIACLDELIDQTGGRRNERFRAAVERGAGALSRARKWAVELTAALEGRPSKGSGETLDPVHVLRQAAARVATLFEEAGVALDVLVPAQLPIASGDGERLETALVRLLRLRMAKAEPGSAVMLAGRRMGRDAVLISVVDRPRRAGAPDEDHDDREPKSLCEAVEPLGGRVHTVSIANAGRATAVRLPIARGAA